MSERRTIHTRLVILQKIAYSNTSLVLAGLTPDYGMVRLIVSGARALSKKHYAQADLFQLMEVEFIPSDDHEKLVRPARLESLRDHTALASRLPCYHAAGWIARFLILNLHEGTRHPRLFQALLIALERLGSLPETEVAVAAARAGIAITFLDEEGMLDAYAADPEAARRCQLLLDTSQGTTPLPRLDSETWQQIDAWLESLLTISEARMP
jgi:recombinational DNA repair protein (RecF pathway)